MAGRAGVEGPPGLFPLPTWGWRGDALGRLLAVTWPLDHLDLPGYRLRYALADRRAERLKILIVQVVSGHGIRAKLRRDAGIPRQVLARALGLGGQGPE